MSTPKNHSEGMGTGHTNKLPKGVTEERIIEAYSRLNGSIRAVHLELKVGRRTVREVLKRNGLGKKPLVAGSTTGIVTKKQELPSEGSVHRYIVTSIQNNTKLEDKVWENLKALAKFYHARILVGTYSYNQNAYGELAVKRGKKREYQKDLWYALDGEKDPQGRNYISDQRLQLAPSLVWCGEMNILPTAVNPLEGLETYSARKSAIFPHAKMAMRSIAGPMGQSAKLIYTTGTVTKRNYIAKRAGLVAEFHHIYGGLIVEVNASGNWWVRQLNAVERTGEIQDLTVVVKDGKVSTGNTVEAITWGDMHAANIDPEVLELSAGEGGMLDELKPKYQFIHDLVEGSSVNHHNSKKPLERYRTDVRQLGHVHVEMQVTSQVLRKYERKDFGKIKIVNSNHDRWLDKFLDNYDPKRDSPRNAELYFAGNAERFKQIRNGVEHPNVLEHLLREFGSYDGDAEFLGINGTFMICGKIECAWHGDLGPNGTQGTESALSKVARLANVGDTHKAGIFSGLYVAGVSCKLDQFYNHGPSSWSHSHIVTYPNAKRCIVTMYNGAWRG